MNLFALEVRRALARRMVRVLVALAVLIIGLAGVLVFVNSRAGFDTDAALAQAERVRAGQLASCEYEMGPGRCENFVPPAEAFVDDHRFHLTSLWENGDGAIGGAGFLLVVVALVAGASFIGAEWRFGSMATHLTWEPRRRRVLLSKIAAAAVVAAGAAVALQALLVVALLPAAFLRGTTAGADVTWLGDLAGTILRMAGLAGLSAMLGGALASVGRNTSAAIGALFVYAIGLEGFIGGWKPGWRTWMLGYNLGQVATGVRQATDGFIGHSVAFSAVLLAAYAAVLVFVATTLFARRDVTA